MRIFLLVLSFFILLISIGMFNKKHVEAFSLLNCDLSNSESRELSNEDYLCCKARKFLRSGDKNHDQYDYFKNIYDYNLPISFVLILYIFFFLILLVFLVFLIFLIFLFF